MTLGWFCRLLVVAALWVCGGAVCIPSASAGTLYLKSCSLYRDNALGAWQGSSTGSKLSSANRCAQGGSLQLLAEGPTLRGKNAQWNLTTSSQIALRAVYVPSNAVLVNPSAHPDGYLVRFLWDGGSHTISDTGEKCCGGMDYGTGISTSFVGPKHWLVIQLACTKAKCSGVFGQALDVKGIELTATDTSPPTITPDETTPNIAKANGRWIRGIWDASFTAGAQDGVCQARVLLNGVIIARGQSYTPHTGSWTQCGGGAGTLNGSGTNRVTASVDTTRYANGPLTVQYVASDAAQPANVAAPRYHFDVDNAPVALGLAGPTSALTTDGPQAVVATAEAGPSGVDGIYCSVDGSPNQWHAGASEVIRVAHLGLNHIACFAENNAIDPQGARARSPLETWTVDIREPSVSLVSLVHVADALHCVRRHVRVHIPAHWTTERYHGRRIRVRVPAQTRRVKVVRCHPRVKRIRVWRNGRPVTERVLELPHRVASHHEQVSFGSPARISGWLGISSGNALGGQMIEVMTAPADGSPTFTLATEVRTRSNGTWTARLPAGPSRLIKAVYPGTSQIAPAASDSSSIAVPASPVLHVQPRRTHWGSAIRIFGRLRGGYIPASGELVVLRIGWHGGVAEIGHVYTDLAGHFAATYTFLRGSGSEHYRIWAQTVRESDYPFQPAASRKILIRVRS